MLSQKAANLKTSPTLALVAKAKELQAAGHDVISLTVGEPDWPTFSGASEAGVEAIRKGLTKYTAANGTLELRKEIQKSLKRDLAVDFTPAEITVGPGAKFVIFQALQMLCDPGDEVILHSPYWVSYPTMIELSGGVPKVVECGADEGFKLSAKRFEAAITSKTKAFLFCSPSNPTGLTYTADELRELAEVLRRHPRVIVLSDDIYNRLVFDGSRVAPHLLHVAPDLKERVLCINGGSKAFSMTGWRIGWAAGPAKLIKAMGDYQSQATGSPSSISQEAARAVINTSEGEIAEVVKKLIARKELATKLFGELPGFRVTPPTGAFYLWVDVRGVYGRKHDGKVVASDKDVCDILLEKDFVATVPGIECGSPGYMRLSIAASEENLRRAADRMRAMIARLV